MSKRHPVQLIGKFGQERRTKKTGCPEFEQRYGGNSGSQSDSVDNDNDTTMLFDDNDRDRDTKKYNYIDRNGGGNDREMDSSNKYSVDNAFGDIKMSKGMTI